MLHVACCTSHVDRRMFACCMSHVACCTSHVVHVRDVECHALCFFFAGATHSRRWVQVGLPVGSIVGSVSPVGSGGTQRYAFSFSEMKMDWPLVVRQTTCGAKRAQTTSPAHSRCPVLADPRSGRLHQPCWKFTLSSFSGLLALKEPLKHRSNPGLN